MTTSVPAAVDRMAGHLTAPFARGADRLDLRFAAGATASRGTVEAYDFAEHRARFGVEPKPRYIVRALRPVAVDTTLTVHHTVRSQSRTVEVFVPAGAAGGDSFAIPLGADAIAATLTEVTAAPAGAAPVQESWRLTALLGDLAAVLWVLGAERDTLTGALAASRGQRALAAATGRSLDLIGADLAVRRFPPLPYASDPDTVALYHLDEAAGATLVADAMAVRNGGQGHPGTVSGALPGAGGRFGGGARFDDQSEISVPDHADFAVPATADLTVECFVLPEGTGVDSPVLTKQADAAGWALSIGTFDRAIPGNVRFLVADAQRVVTLFADLSVRPDRFHHLAGVVDRANARARLYVDGELRASQPITGLGALTNDAPVRIGRALLPRGAALRGVVDEVRVSRVARHAFHPVLGEGDDGYRRRLAIFRRWTLPTPANLQRALNDATGEVAGVREPFLLEDAETPPVTGSRAITVRPVTLNPGESIDALGRRDTDEAATCGVPADDDQFDPLLLADAADPRVIFAGAAGRMRVATRRALRALLELLEFAPGRLAVTAGFDPAAPDLRSVGRALVLRHPAVPAGRLAALAHRAGFSWVRHTGDVYASVAATTTVELTATEDGDPPPPGIDLVLGRPAEITLDPAPPPGTRPRWSIVRHEHGRADLVSRGDEPTCRLRPTRTGRLVVSVELNRAGRTITGSRILRVGVRDLPLDVGIAEDGRSGVDESVAGDAGDAPFLPSYPVPFFDLRLQPPTTRDCRLHPALHAPLLRLLDLLESEAFPDQTLRLATAWRPESPGLDGVGRAITLEPAGPGVPMGQLGALAHAAGFDYVRAGTSTLRLAHRATTVTLFEAPVTDVDEGSEVRFGVTPNPYGAAVVLAGPLVCLMNLGTSTVTMLDPTTGTVLRGASTGLLPVAIAVAPDGATVYTAHFATRSLSAIAVATGQVVGTLPLAREEQRMGLAHRPDRPELLILTEKALVAMNTATRATRATATLAAPALRMAMEPNGQRAWIAFADRTVRMITVDPMTVGPPVTVPGVPVDIAVTTNTVLVTVESGLLCVIVKSTGAVTSFTDVGARPTALAVDSTTVYVADEAAGRIVPRTVDGKPVAQPAVPITGRITSLLAAAGKVYFTTAAGAAPISGVATAGVVTPTQPHAAPTMWPLGSGFGERLTWTAQPGADARVTLRDVHTNEVLVRAERAGPVLLSARFLPRDRMPFSVRVQLHPDLAARARAGTRFVVRREQYERAMNVLSELHPLGVEIDTRVLREHVLELPSDPFPNYTFPSYRGLTRG